MSLTTRITEGFNRIISALNTLNSSKNPIKRKFLIPVDGSTTPNVAGFFVSSAGTVTAKALSNTNAYTKTTILEYLTTASTTAKVYCENTIATGAYLRPNTSTTWAITAGPASGLSNPTRRFALGIGQANVTADVDPSTITNGILLGYGSADTNVQIMYNDGSGTASKIDTGWAKPTTDRTNVYTLRLWTNDVGVTWNYKAINWATDEILTGVLTTDLPNPSNAFCGGCYASVGGTSYLVGVGFGGIIYEEALL
jgi:hypothetical protein